MTVRNRFGDESQASVIPLSWAVLGTLAVVLMQALAAGVLYGTLRANVSAVGHDVEKIGDKVSDLERYLQDARERLARIEGRRPAP